MRRIDELYDSQITEQSAQDICVVLGAEEDRVRKAAIVLAAEDESKTNKVEKAVGRGYAFARPAEGKTKNEKKKVTHVAAGLQ